MDTAGTSPLKSHNKQSYDNNAPTLFINRTIDFDAKFRQMRHENDQLLHRESLDTILVNYRSGKSSRRNESKSAVINGALVACDSSTRSRSSGGRKKQREQEDPRIK
ncbi:hypothetical protein FGO68_gene2299 [Halteria grandinella]|uniref:Uncharacterized protein n=1 Tax=Halteria grandinella TaxID=5974 RepID=A0A8J8NL11_HALGN|nr:hypothetical protein FGO68_gene2299 [Halteria grandinella]